MTAADGAVAGGVFASLRTPNYRIFFTGQLISITGSWLQTTAQAWLVLETLDAGAGALGVLMACTFLPTLLFGLWAGVIADRFDRRRILLVVQTWMLFVAAVQATVVLTGVIELWMVFLLAGTMGLANTVEMPTRQAFITELVGADRVPNAVGLNSATFNLGRVLGPAIGGVLVALVGEGWCFALNSLSFLAVIIGLSRLRIPELFPAKRIGRAPGQIRDGLRHAWESPVLRSTLALVAIVGSITLNWTIVLPLLAKETFDGGPELVGIMTAVFGVGSLCGSLAAARRTAPTLQLLAGSAVLLGLAELGLAVAPTLSVALVAVAVTGFGFMTMMLTANSTLQLNSAPDKRGRVMALYTMMFAGTTPIGGPFVGWAGDHWGPRAPAALGGGAALVAAAVVVALRRAPGRAATPALAPATPATPTPIGALAAAGDGATQLGAPASSTAIL